MKRAIMRLITILLSISILCSLPISVHAQLLSDTASDGVVWEYDPESDTLTFSGTGEIALQDEEVYETWRIYLSEIKNLIIADGITAIGASVFSGIPNLQSVSIAESVTRIDYDAFRNCTALTNISIGTNVAQMGADVFKDTAFYLNEDHWNLDVLYLESYLLCARTTVSDDYTVSINTTVIADRAFYGCTNLTEVYIYEKLQKIGDEAFFECSSLRGIYVSPNSETYYSSESGVLFNKAKTELILCPMKYAGKLELPGTLTSIADYACYRCNDLTEVTIPNGVQSIGDYAFYQCTAIQSVTIPDSVTKLGMRAFSECSGVVELNIGAGLETISSSAFSLCTALQQVVIPDSVLRIETSAFASCSVLYDITIGENIGYIGTDAFQNTAFEANSQNWTNGILYLGDCLLKADANTVAENLVISDGVRLIAGSAFTYCTNLLSIEIPESVVSIGDSAFSQCNGIETITLSEGLEHIGAFAFYNCSGFNVLNIPDSVCEIGIFAFADCSGLMALGLGNGLKTIGECAFLRCTSLTSVKLPKSVESIGREVFHGCTSLTGIFADEANAYYCSDEYGVLYNKSQTVLLQVPPKFEGRYTVPQSVVKIEDSAFFNCVGLTEVIIGDCVEMIGGYAFGNCTALQKVYFAGQAPVEGGESSDTLEVTSGNLRAICHEAFYGCTLLTEVKIPYSVYQIGYGAFTACTSLEKIMIYQPLCIIATLEQTLADPTTCVIYGFADSTAQAYAQANSQQFELLQCGHEYVFVEQIQPTCTQEGYQIYECSICADRYESDYINALGHSYEIIETIEPTCQLGGYSIFVCSLCSDTYEGEATPIADHRYELIEKIEPTCNKEGYSVYACIWCEDSYQSDFLPYADHDYVIVEQVPPTCTQKGYNVYQCTICGDSYKGDYINRLGHDYQDGFCTRCDKEEPEYIDVSTSDWYYDAVKFVTDQGLMNGVSADNFAPDAPMTRAMLVTVLWRAEGQPKIGTNYFTDVPNDEWYTDAIAWASYYQIVNGVGNRKFDPDGMITREQIATILFRFSDFLGYGTDGRSSLNSFPDHSKVSDWAKDAVCWAVAQELIKGTQTESGVYLDPQGKATRAQVATILMRFLDDK